MFLVNVLISVVFVVAVPFVVTSLDTGQVRGAGRGAPDQLARGRAVRRH